MEQIRGWEHPREPERHRNPEVARLRAAIERVVGIPIGDPGQRPTKEGRFHQLEMLLAEEPQRDSQGDLRYLLTSGLAVELVTGFERFHHDIDFVIMDPSDVNRWDMIGTDNVTPGKYWADMKFDANYLEETARLQRIRNRRHAPEVEVVHPAIILVQKSSDAFGRPPRKRDVEDVDAIVRHWKEIEGFTREWNPIVEESINALPKNQHQKTLNRLRSVAFN